MGVCAASVELPVGTQLGPYARGKITRAWRFSHKTACVFRSSLAAFTANIKKVKCMPYSITERTIPELIPVLGSQPTGDVSHKPGGMLPLLSARPAVTVATLKRAAVSFAAW